MTAKGKFANRPRLRQRATSEVHQTRWRKAPPFADFVPIIYATILFVLVVDFCLAEQLFFSLSLSLSHSIFDDAQAKCQKSSLYMKEQALGGLIPRSHRVAVVLKLNITLL